MAEWTEAEDRVDRAIRDSALAEQVIYTPADGRAVAIRGKFSPTSIDVDPGTLAEIITEQPVLEIREADLRAPAAQGDGVRVRGVDYTVYKKSRLGMEWLALQLHEA